MNIRNQTNAMKIKSKKAIFLFSLNVKKMVFVLNFQNSPLHALCIVHILKL